MSQSDRSNIAIITGCSAGIGRAAAERFVAEGWAVHNLSRRLCAIDGVVDHAVDLSDLDALDAAAAELRDALPSEATVCLVHNAAVQVRETIDAIERDAFERAMRLNVTAPALLSSLLIPSMGEGSSIIYIGSTLSEQAVAGMTSYVTSKHAMVGLMRATVQDLFGRGIHTALVCPGFTDTEMVRPTYDQSEAFRSFIAGKVSTGRLISGDEMAEVVYRAAVTPVLNGAVLHANAGQRMT